MTTYTATCPENGTVFGRGLTLEEACVEIMTYDGHEFEIRPDGIGFTLWTTTWSRNSTAYKGLTESTIYSLKADEETARADIFAQVAKNADWFKRCDIMTDEAHDAMLAEIADELDE